MTTPFPTAHPDPSPVPGSLDSPRPTNTIEQEAGRPAKAERTRNGGAGLPPLLTIQDLSLLFQRSERQLYRDMAAGRFPDPSIRLGKKKLWRLEVITEFVESGGKRTKPR